jgi:thiol-disulfide isomerase/thioredoxin
MLARTLTTLAVLATLTACGDDGGSAASTSATGGGGNDAGATTGSSQGGSSAGGGAQGGAGQGGADPGPMRKTIEGDITWQVTFDATAASMGKTDCSYTRHYVGTEDASRPWVCPACEVVFRADVEMTAGKTDCYAQISDGEPLAEEWIGYGGGVWYRGYGPMSDQGTMTLDGAAITTTNSVPDQPLMSGGAITLDVVGALTLGAEPGDAMNGFVPPATYACGWPKADPPPYTGDYTIAVGQQLPDGVFKDTCDEAVRLHDLKGKFLIVDMSARDCPPCQAMADAEPAFMEELAMQGIEVEVVTLLAPSLANPLGDTTTGMLTQWSNNYGIASPVLADRSWGIAMFAPLFGDQVAYPSWVVADENLQVIEVGSGFDNFDAARAAILAAAAP